MKNSSIAFCLVSFVSATLFAALDEKDYVCPPGVNESEFMCMIEDGGHVFRPKTGHGTFAFRNCQKRVPKNDLDGAVSTILVESWLDIRIVDDPTAKANATVDIVDTTDCHSLVVFPDESRAVVNIGALAKDSPSPDVLASRVRKQMVRAFSYLTGITGGGKTGLLMDVMSDLPRLDAAKEQLPMELVLRNAAYLERLGIKPFERTTYRRACEEGWANAPSNKYQQVVWDEVHQKPTKGLKIKYDPKKGE